MLFRLRICGISPSSSSARDNGSGAKSLILFFKAMIFWEKVKLLLGFENKWPVALKTKCLRNQCCVEIQGSKFNETTLYSKVMISSLLPHTWIGIFWHRYIRDTLLKRNWGYFVTKKRVLSESSPPPPHWICLLTKESENVSRDMTLQGHWVGIQARDIHIQVTGSANRDISLQGRKQIQAVINRKKIVAIIVCILYFKK
jgi:hypothetical protein